MPKYQIANTLETSDETQLVFAHCSEGWHLLVYYSEGTDAWWLDCPDMEYDHGLIQESQLVTVLLSHSVNLISLFKEQDDWRQCLKDSIKDLACFSVIESPHAYSLINLFNSLYQE